MTKTKTSAATLDQIPPYCYLMAGMSVEAGALAAAKALRMIPCDALALLWELRRVASNDEAEYPSAPDNHAEAYFEEFFELPHPLPPIKPQKPTANAASKPLQVRLDPHQPCGKQSSSHQKEIA